MLRRWEVLVLTVIASLVANGLASAIKWAIPRHRPRVHQLVTSPHTHSFPSGHSATAFACAVVLGSLVPALRVPVLLLAAAVAYSRLYVGVHFPLDVLGGAVLGIATALLLLAIARRRSPRARRSG